MCSKSVELLLTLFHPITNIKLTLSFYSSISLQAQSDIFGCFKSYSNFVAVVHGVFPLFHVVTTVFAFVVIFVGWIHSNI